MILAGFAMIGATATAAGLTWRLIKVVKQEGTSAFLTTRADEVLLHACLLFVLALFLREGIGLLFHAQSEEMMAGYGALFGGTLATCLARAKSRPGPIASEAQNG